MQDFLGVPCGCLHRTKLLPAFWDEQGSPSRGTGPTNELDHPQDRRPLESVVPSSFGSVAACAFSQLRRALRTDMAGNMARSLNSCSLRCSAAASSLAMVSSRTVPSAR